MPGILKIRYAALGVNGYYEIAPVILLLWCEIR